MKEQLYTKILEEQKKKLEKQIASARMKYYGLKSELKGVMKAIDAVKGNPEKKINLKQEILTVLEDNNPEGLYASEVAAKIEEKNNLTVLKPSVSSTLSRLKKEKVVDCYDRKYTLRKDDSYLADF